MTDPLSIAAGVGGLVSLGLQSIEYLYNFYTSYRDRNEELEKTVNQLHDLLGVLRNVQSTISTRQWRIDERSILQSLEACLLQCEDVVAELGAEVQKFKKEPTDNFGRQITTWGRRAAYPLRRSTLEKLKEDIRDFHDNLSQALEVLQLKEHQNTQRELEVLKEMMRYTQAEHLTRSLRDWLRPPDATVDYNAAAAKRHAGTGQWFIQSPALKAWLQRDNSFLWLYGFAGCGKSVLCSTVIQHVFRRRHAQTNSAAAFFFFTFNDQSKQDASALLRALLAQLAGQIPGVDADLVHLEKVSNGGTPPVRTLIEHVRQAVARSHHTYILLDAIDECPEGNLRDDVLDTIETMRAWSLPGFHLLTTSRNILDIRDALNPQVQEMVALENDEVQSDIRQYVSDCLERDPKLRRWQDKRQTIQDYLVKHAKGVFRWVDCQLEPLRRCPQSQYDLERCLKQLPIGLDATYERMLSTIDEYSQERARRILVLLSLAARDLSVAEVIEALAVDVDEQERYDPARRLSGSDDLLRICPGLIVIVQRSADNTTEDDSVDDETWSLESDEAQELCDPTASQLVRIAHFSVQEYLLSDRIRKGSVANFALSKVDDHAQISKTCLIYLCHNDFLSQPLTRQLVRQYAFAPFAAQYWFYHFKQDSKEFAERLQPWGMTFFSKDVNVARWIRLYDVDASQSVVVSPGIRYQNHDDEKTITKHSLNMIYFLALLGLHSLLAEMLVDSKACINAYEGFHGNALQAASVHGHEKVVQILIAAGADVDAQGGDYGSALHTASEKGHEKVVQILIAAGADVNAQGGSFYDNILQAASGNGHEKVVQMLIAAGADVNAQGGYYYNALLAPSGKGYEKVVQMLIAAGADVDAQGGYYSNSLQAASGNGHEKVVQMLIAAGADVNAQGRYYSNSLYAASHQGREKVVQMLIAAGADVNAQGGYYYNALLAPSGKGYEKVV